MALELGERLVEVGLLTRAQLDRHGVLPHGAALVRRLVQSGLVEEALAGFFLAEGFGPLAARDQLRDADATLVGRLPPSMAWDFLVLPLRETRSGVVVAMAVPSDRHLVRETARLIGKSVLPTVARIADLTSELAVRHPDARPAPPPRHDSEPPVLQLTRRRSKPAGPASASVGSPSIEPPAGRSSFLPVAGSDGDDVPVPLVRHKPILSKPPSAPSIVPEAILGSAPGVLGPLVPRSDPQPTGTNKASKLVQKSFPAPVSRSESAAAFRSGREERKVKTSEYEAATGKPVDPKLVSVPPTPAVPPLASRAPSSAQASAPRDGAPSPSTEIVETVDALAPAPTDRWDLPAPAAKPDAKLAAPRASLPSNKSAAGDITPTLAAMKTARDRDAIVRLACEGAITVGRSSVFLALRKGVLKGWDGSGQGVSRDSVRNLWIPAGSDSMFKRVLDSGAPFVGAYGQGIADGLFRAAVGSRGGDVAVWPVSLEGKTVGLLCIDDLRPGSISRHRIETLTVAISEGFRRLISTGKND